jgi:glucose/arabinose dehydrogenase
LAASLGQTRCTTTCRWAHYAIGGLHKADRTSLRIPWLQIRGARLEAQRVVTACSGVTSGAFVLEDGVSPPIGSLESALPIRIPRGSPVRFGGVLSVVLVVLAVMLQSPAATDALAPSAAGTLSLSLVQGGFSSPVFVTHAGDNRLFVVERSGRIKLISGGQVLPTPFLDMSSLVTTATVEQGLLGLAFDPAYATNGRFYIMWTANGGSGTNTSLRDNMVSRFVRTSSDPNRADFGSRSDLLKIADAYNNHNGGMLAFWGGLLYVATGDGGSSGDPDNNAQNTGVLLGKLLRIDPNNGSPYAIPPGNPFTNQPGARPEIWAYGLRNPWRFSFDRANGNLYIADVGQNTWEEVNLQRSSDGGGQNYGWDRMEGNHCFGTSTCNQTGLVLPIAEYPHGTDGCAVTGGYVYRGASAPSLSGKYIFGDYCSGRIWSLTDDAGTWTRSLLLTTTYGISSFAEDKNGELYVVDHDGGGIYRLTESGVTPPGTPTPTVTSTATQTPTVASTATQTPTSTRTPTPGAGGPDLIITAFSASNTTEDQGVPVSITVANQGTVAANGAFDVHFFVDLDRPPMPTDGGWIGHLEVHGLAAGQSRTLQAQMFPGQVLTGPGQRTLWALVDGHDVVDEPNEGNNARSTKVRVRKAR